MKLQIFSVYDSKSESWLQPYYSLTVNSGMRAFSDICRDEAHSFYQNGGDYTLFHLGEFDQSTGDIQKLHTPENLGLAINFRPTAEQQAHLRGIQGGE